MSAANSAAAPAAMGAAHTIPATPAGPPALGGAAAIVTANASLAQMVLQIAVPHDTLRRTFAELDGNPRGGPRYAKRHQHDDLNRLHAVGEVHSGIHLLLAELASAPDVDPALIEVFRNAEAVAQADGRLDRFDQAHNITEFAHAVASVAEWVTAVRLGRHRSANARMLGAAKPQPLAEISSLYGAPQWQIRTLAHRVAFRWLPSMQCIVSRLPMAARQSAADNAQRLIGEFMQSMCRLHALTRKASDEYRRWERGFGALDMAVVQAAGMVAELKDMAEHMEPSADPLCGELLTRAREASAEVRGALDMMAPERLSVLAQQAWLRRKADILAFARATGGIAPEVEVLYHAKGSRFVADASCGPRGPA